MDTAKVIQVIETTLTRRGNGKDTPIRIVTEYWSLDGRLLVESDPCVKVNKPLSEAEKSALDRAKILLKKYCDRDNYHYNDEKHKH